MDYFNAGETEKQAQFAAKRDAVFRPAVRVLAALGASPTQVSILGVAFAILAAAASGMSWIAVAVLMVLYVLMDGLDGPLARHTGRQGQGGSLVDIFADQVGVIIIAVGAVVWIDSDPVLQVGFAFLYISAIYLMVICNLLKIHMPPIVRVKYIYFGLYVAVLAVGHTWLLDLFAGGFLLYYLGVFLVLFRKVKPVLDGWTPP